MDLSILIVNFNTRDLLRNCLDSVRKTVRDLSYEIIVVDNASRDASAEMVHREFPGVFLIANSENRGFGAANNQGLAVMRGEYALLLNSDAVLAEQAVSELVSFMRKTPGAGMACGQLLNADGSKQNSIAPFPSFWTLLLNLPLLEILFPKRYPSKRYAHPAPLEVDSGIGACLLVRKEALRSVGLFDERYFFFFEETDWALRMKAAGWKVFHVPSARIYHLQGQSIGGDIASRIEFYRSRYRFIRKWSPAGRAYFLSALIVLRLWVNWLLTCLAVFLTLGLSRKLREKSLVYSRLLLWHLPGRPNRQ